MNVACEPADYLIIPNIAVRLPTVLVQFMAGVEDRMNKYFVDSI